MLIVYFRRLEGAGGHPMAISDDSIHANPPSDLPGFSSATSMAVNVKVARITGEITSSKADMLLVSGSY